jgi:hypothetical protein
MGSVTINYDEAKAHISRLLETEIFDYEADITPSSANPNALFLCASEKIHGDGKDRLSVPIRFAVDGPVIDQLAHLDEERRKIFAKHFLRFVENRMSGYDRDRGVPKSGHDPSFDIIFDGSDLKSFYDALKSPST